MALRASSSRITMSQLEFELKVMVDQDNTGDTYLSHGLNS